jgi:hypothetical protein
MVFLESEQVQGGGFWEKQGKRVTAWIISRDAA